MSGHLYDGGETLLFGAGLALEISRPVCRIVYDHDTRPEWSDGNVDRQWLLPPGPDPRPFNLDMLCDLVDVLDSSGVVAILGTEEAAVQTAMDAVLTLVGGWRT